MYKTIFLKKEDRVAIVTISRPRAMNALNLKVLEELCQVFDEIEHDDSLGGVILTGEGRAFVAGADIGEMREMNRQEGLVLAEKGHGVMTKIEGLSKPVIAAVNGFALGGGCELAMACDFRIVSGSAKFGLPEVGLGIIPGFGGTQRMSRLVGKGQAKLLVLSGEIIDADEAFRIGLADRLVPPASLLEEAQSVLLKILEKSPSAVSNAKKAIDGGFDLELSEALSLEKELFAALFSTGDQKEGMNAFLEKRKPSFTGK